MAQTSRRFNSSKKEAFALSREPCLEFSRQCLEEARTMTSPRASQSLEVINYKQCEYLIDSLEKAVDKAWLFLEHNRHHGGDSASSEDVRESTLEPLKILCMLAKKVKCFIEGCCTGHWLHAAVMMRNFSDFTVSLGFDLKLFADLLPPYIEFGADSLMPLTIRQVSNWMAYKREVVKERASLDKGRLVTKLSALIQGGSASDDDLELATFLRETLDNFSPSSPSHTRGSLEPILRKRDLANLEHMEHIRSGEFSSVYRARWLGIDVAVKRFYSSGILVFMKELSILAGLSHPNIASFLCHGRDLGDCFVVMELMDRDLFSLMKERLRSDRTRSSPFSVFEEFDIILQIAEAMEYLHGNRVLHRDLKSGNILVRCMMSKNGEGYEYVQVKVSDFGLSRTKESSMTQSHLFRKTGTARWMAPELIQLPNIKDILDIEMAEDEELMQSNRFKCDVYSFGMVCWEILTGSKPFPDMTHK